MSTSHTKRARSRKTTRFIVMMFHSHWPDSSPLDAVFLERFLRMLEDSITTEPANTEIDLWLVSPGGCVHAAYRIWLALRARSSWLRVVIPDAAQSAAALLALGSDEIIMGPASVLGPLDVQWSHPDNDEQTISGLDIAEYPKFLIKLAAEHIDSEVAAQFFQPLADNLDGLLTMRVLDELEVAVKYGETVLNGRVQAASNDFCPLTVAKHFVHGYPAHAYSICRQQAADLGLPIIFLETFKDRSLVRASYNQWLDLRDEDNRQPSVTTIQRANP